MGSEMCIRDSFDDNNEFFVLGCMDSASSNFNPDADIDFGCSTDRSTSIFNIPDVECRNRHQCPEIFERVEILMVYDLMGRTLATLEPQDFLTQELSFLIRSSGLHIVVGFDSAQRPIYSEKVVSVD